MSSEPLLPTTVVEPYIMTRQDRLNINAGIPWSIGSLGFFVVTMVTLCESPYPQIMSITSLALACLSHTCSFSSLPDKNYSEERTRIYCNWFKANQFLACVATLSAISAVVVAFSKSNC